LAFYQAVFMGGKTLLHRKPTAAINL